MLGYDYKLLTRLWGAQHSSDGVEQSVNMANVNKKKKKKGDEAEIEVCESKISAETDTNAMIIQAVPEKEVPISEMDLFSVPAMNNAYNICHNVQVGDQ